MRALNDIVIVERRKPQTTIHLVQHKECIGQVLEVGPGRYIKRGGKDYFLATTVKKGDYIMWTPRVGQDAERKIDGKDLTFIREADIMAIVDPEEIDVTDNGIVDPHRECVAKMY